MKEITPLVKRRKETDLPIYANKNKKVRIDENKQINLQFYYGTYPYIKYRK